MNACRPLCRPWLPPSDPAGFFNKLEKALAFFDKEGKDIILLGDNNCDLAKKSTDQIPDNNGKLISRAVDLVAEVVDSLCYGGVSWSWRDAGDKRMWRSNFKNFVCEENKFVELDGVRG
eukprot:gene16165-biopygen5460